MIKDVRNINGVGQEKIATGFLKRLQKPLPQGMSNKIVKAEINHSRWIVKCPFCSGAELADKNDPRFFCLSCFNKTIGGQWAVVTFPENGTTIENELVKRPKIEHRNWTNETLTKLRLENKEAGL